ncbi:Diaminopimelate decarboxylase [Gracilariopsis chorda]|uniref:Diaminopimelate decarboxylase n=1 Tax=Gracilariopsis chorda TaxID=448386 RepID=A0A2V3IKW4_9FLOR|nr:Diaminopimelate decarboxylase [Gracilariopsis chorda]|eukprot:PXF41770.1 Diaminopimelate decarboxylase [Gracilariopsis chorda]
MEATTLAFSASPFVLPTQPNRPAFNSRRPATRVATKMIRQSVKTPAAPPGEQLAITPNNFIAQTLRAAIADGTLCSASPVAIFYDLQVLRHNARALRAAFPDNTLHAFALKAAPFPRLLEYFKEEGIGAECASVVELACSEAAGIPSENVIFDSPAKTNEQLMYALKRGFHVNADSISELKAIAVLRDECQSTSTIGLRVNPQLGSATIAETFTASKACKFGEGLREKRDDIIAAFERYPFVSCVHVHVGSQGCAVDVIADGAKAAAELADDVNSRVGSKQVHTIDIGGGLSVDYFSDVACDFDTLPRLLRERCDGLFKYRLMTEFGRHMSAKTAFMAAQVTALKQSGGKTYVICQVGADVLMRPVYQPEKWAHRLETYDHAGQLKQSRSAVVEVGGPLCFAGDIIARDRELVMPTVGDWLVVRDAGAYTLSMHMRHTSQLAPPVFGVERDGSRCLLKRGETIEDSVRFWSA